MMVGSTAAALLCAWLLARAIGDGPSARRRERARAGHRLTGAVCPRSAWHSAAAMRRAVVTICLLAAARAPAAAAQAQAPAAPAARRARAPPPAAPVQTQMTLTVQRVGGRARRRSPAPACACAARPARSSRARPSPCASSSPAGSALPAASRCSRGATEPAPSSSPTGRGGPGTLIVRATHDATPALGAFVAKSRAVDVLPRRVAPSSGAASIRALQRRLRAPGLRHRRPRLLRRAHGARGARLPQGHRDGAHDERLDRRHARDRARRGALRDQVSRARSPHRGRPLASGHRADRRAVACGGSTRSRRASRARRRCGARSGSTPRRPARTPRAWSTRPTSSAATRRTATPRCRPSRPATAACACRSPTRAASSTGSVGTPVDVYR